MIAPEHIVERVRVTYGRTVEEIIKKLPERDIHDILGAIHTLVGSKIARKLKTSPAERMLFASTWMVIEVHNGGFHQYFFNSAGDFWKDVLGGLSAIGDEHGFSLFRRVLSIFPNESPSEDRFVRQKQLSELEERDERAVTNHFSRTTDEYFREPFPKWELVLDHVKMHADQFDLQNA
jgi:hypothetical protein